MLDEYLRKLFLNKFHTFLGFLFYIEFKSHFLKLIREDFFKKVTVFQPQFLKHYFQLTCDTLRLLHSGW